MVDMEDDERCGDDLSDPPWIARTLLWALFNCCCARVSRPPLDLLNATVIVSDSPS